MAGAEHFDDRERCITEMKQREATLRSGSAAEMEGVLQGLQDWSAELREIEKQMQSD